MKVIISHDIDHLTVLEHKKDLIIPKFIVKSCIELVIKTISFREFFNRFKDFLKNKWHNLEELMKFDKENGIKATFFIGVNKGLGLSYNIEDAKFWIHEILKEGFDVGIHGIEYKDLKKMEIEYKTFKKISGLSRFGIRMHYLRMDKLTLINLEKLGYLFDSSVYTFKNPYKFKSIYEFPLHIMDGFVICGNRKFLTQNLNKIKDDTKYLLDQAFQLDIQYLTVLFHDRYFSNSFETWKKWYIWFIEYLKDNNFKFINYKEAIMELNSLDI